VASQLGAEGRQHAVLRRDLVVARRRERGGGGDRAVDDGGRREGEERRLGSRWEAGGRAAQEGLAGDEVVGVVSVPPLRMCFVISRRRFESVRVCAFYYSYCRRIRGRNAAMCRDHCC
jgi:hypothetical protein